MATKGTIGNISVKVQPDLSAFRQASVSELAALLGEHIYGDTGPYAAGDDLSVCTRMAQALVERYNILPR